MEDVRKYIGPETRKALSNFGEGGLPRELIGAYAEVKQAVLSAIQEVEQRWSPPVWKSLSRAVEEVKSGGLDDQFPLPLFQGGAGTSINMNVNEVIAARANELLEEEGCPERVDALDDVNRYQSTNDTFPTAVTIVLYWRLLHLEQQVIRLQAALAEREGRYAHILMVGRTELQDALPITLGQVFGSWAGMFERDRWRLHKIKERIRTVPLGGTAVGTGFPAPAMVVFAAEEALRRITGLPLARSQNLPDEVAHQDKWSELAHGIRQVAENLVKLTGDLLLYTSSFLGELGHPEVQAGSTIMAAKTNPVFLEYARGLAFSAQHACDAVSTLSQQGQLQLNPYLPFILHHLLQAFTMVGTALETLTERLLPALEVREDRIHAHLLASHTLLNALLPLLGYHGVKELYRLHPEPFSSMDELVRFVVDHTDLEEVEVRAALDPGRATSFVRRVR
ncbi:lyase family protein [Spirochaeta thermophila]|uniref:lyase family protein n=1 Tax=Winmispira thermophila TaxID=154 RepID=UPI0003121FD5|nr:lyase family protein [Spirochaeta thermophila]